MSIDDAIDFERYLSKQPEICNEDFMKCEEHKQLAEWLEELKEARKGFEENRKAGYSHGYADGYAKAVDEFLEEMEKWNSQIKFMRNESAFFTIDNVREVAEQLKGVQ